MKNNQMLAVESNNIIKKALPCRTVPLSLFPGANRHELAWCAIPEQDSIEQLLESFAAAPQFAQIDMEKLLHHKGEEPFRVLLLGENDYYLRQAAAYLTALSHKNKKAPAADDTDSFWEDLNIYIPAAENDGSGKIKNSLVTVSPELLDADITQSDTSRLFNNMEQMKRKEKEIDLNSIESAGILIAAGSGAVLTQTVLDKVEHFLEQGESRDVFIAIKSSQMELELIEELRFALGFQLCAVGQATGEYLCRLFRHMVREQGLKLSSDVEPEKVIAQLRRYRGGAFEENDIARLLQRASRLAGGKTLEKKDLMVSSCKVPGAQGLEALQSMVGLQGVKDTLNRVLASYVVEDRRRMFGVEIPVSCRNMAFSGPPGTGKSVTARLVARILREAGCGTGRFVEAGREQLIGAYLGQTSPMVAELFRKARGGVLFIDEAGALLSHDGWDQYAAEAVNALVRHMELEPETIVIFATYPEEMQKLLSSNAGLSSRVAQVIEFPEYEDDALFEIFSRFAQKEKLALPEGAEEICTAFFSQLKKDKGSSFGNGREARRLFQAAKEEMALRTAFDSESEISMTNADIANASERLLAQEKKEERKPIGFAI